MSDVAIQIEGLGKQYHIGGRKVQYKTARDTLANMAKAPFRRAARLLRGHAYGAAGMDEVIWALRDVSFEVEKGEVVGIIGRNGAGKTTLLKILSRITDPTEGRAKVCGRVGSLLEVGTGFHPELTGRENVFLNGAILGMKKKEMERKFDAIIDFAEIEKFTDTPVKYYSSGMYVRLAFAVAAHLEPEILLVDEVLAVGDYDFQNKCLGKMKDVSEEGRTVLFVSHNMPSVRNLCTKGILLESGKKILESSIGDAVDTYMNKGLDQGGEVSWDSQDTAPGNDRLRLKSVRIVSEGQITGIVDISKECRIEVDYWNLEANSRRLVSVHLHNSEGACIFTSANFPSVSIVPDPWESRLYPVGLFRTTCAIPGNFLNDRVHSVSIHLHSTLHESLLKMENVISFLVQDTGAMRKEYSGKWFGAVRPRLDWKTECLGPLTENRKGRDKNA